MTQKEVKQLNSVLDDGNYTLFAKVSSDLKKVVSIDDQAEYFLTHDLQKYRISDFSFNQFFVANPVSELFEEED